MPEIASNSRPVTRSSSSLRDTRTPVQGAPGLTVRRPEELRPRGREGLHGLVGTAVVVGEEAIGGVSGVYLDRRRGRAIGLEVACPGGARLFLPWVAARFGRGRIAVKSARFLIDDGESYRRLGADLVSEPVELAGMHIALDGGVDAPGDVSALVTAGTSPR